MNLHLPLRKVKSVTIHSRNIQLLATKSFRVENGLSPPFINEIFLENTQHYDLRKKLNLREIMLKCCTTDLNL